MQFCKRVDFEVLPVGQGGYGAIAIRPQESHARLFIPFKDWLRRVPEGICLAYGDNGDSRRDSRQKGECRRCLGSVMRYLQEISCEWCMLSDQRGLDALLDIAGQKKMYPSILQSHDDRVIIRCRRYRLRVRWPQDFASHAAPIEPVTLLFVNNFGAARPPLIEQTYECWRLFFAPNPQFFHREILEDGAESLQVIMMRMRQHDHIEPLQSS